VAETPGAITSSFALDVGPYIEGTMTTTSERLRDEGSPYFASKHSKPQCSQSFIINLHKLEGFPYQLHQKPNWSFMKIISLQLITLLTICEEDY
jgi:hypothetical protein